jgi:hypothetical protein
MVARGARWRVLMRWRDGVVLTLNEALSNLPPPLTKSERLKSSFAIKGLYVLHFGMAESLLIMWLC